ncbi:MAG: carboxypeptidase regulatory-like domain-containing protein, partial [Nitrospira sp.]|nr:carboxypeptidase regulatory-like domain-containing protein [Nitrospira sp.]
FSTTVNPDSTYVIRLVPPGTYSAVVVYRGFRSIVKDVVVHEGESLTVDFDFDEPGSVRGRIVGKDGQPLAGVQAWLGDDHDYNPEKANFKTVIGADGGYLIKTIQPGSYVLHLETDTARWGAVERGRRVVVKSEEEVELNLDLSVKLGATIRGRVLVDGKAVSMRVFATNWKTSFSANAELDRDGRFEVHGAPTGDLRLHFYGGAADPLGTYHLADGITVPETLEDVEFVRDLVSVSLSGTVSAPEVEPGFNLAQAVVEVQPLPIPKGSDEFGTVRYLCAANGSFGGRRILAGKYRARAVGGGYKTPWQEHVFEKDATLALTLVNSTGALSVSIKQVFGDKTAGDPVHGTGGWIQVYDLEGKHIRVPGGGSHDIEFGEPGTTKTLEEIPPGRYRVRVGAMHCEDIYIEVEIVAGETTEVTVDLHRYSTLILTIGNPELTLADLKEIKISQDMPSKNGRKREYVHRWLREDNSGRPYLPITGLLQGVGKLTITLPGYETQEIEVSTVRSTRSEMTITLVPNSNEGKSVSKR